MTNEETEASPSPNPTSPDSPVEVRPTEELEQQLPGDRGNGTASNTTNGHAANGGHATSTVMAAIPTFNEELAIGSLVHRAKAHVDEVVVVDDGSTDATVQVARDAGATVLASTRNQGKGAVVRRAFRHAHDQDADVLVLLDGDGQHDPEDIPNLAEAVHPDNDDAKDIALGFRFGDHTEMPLYRRVGKRVLDYATALATGTPTDPTDSQCGFRAFNRPAIAVMATELTDNGFGVESEQLVVARDANLETENVNITCKYEGIDGSTHGPLRHGLGVLNYVVEMMTMKRPLLFMGVPSALLMVAGGGVGIYVLQWWVNHNYFSIPQALGAATLMLVGMLGVMSALILNMMASFRRIVEQSEMSD